jgi:hypothetical protein
MSEPKLLSGGNPQIPKGYGDEPVRAYLEAMPGWKSEVGKQIDEIISETVADLAKAVKWNSPLYGVTGQGWFLGVHCFEKYIKVAFFRGIELHPLPPDPSKQPDVRYYNVREGEFDAEQFRDWIRQASSIPGVKM